MSVVTGAAGAMGSACALTIAPDADVVLLTDVDGDRLAAAAERVEHETATKVSTVVGDLGEPRFIADLAARAHELGELHSLEALLPSVVPGSVAVCLASVSAHMGEFELAMDEVLDDPLTADFEARFETLAGAEPHPGATYRLAKRGVVRLCERAAVSWGARGGRVVSLSPGLIDTGMGRLELEHNPIKNWMAEITPVGGDRSGPDTVLPGHVDDIASAVAFLCSDRAAFISGCDVRVDGGLIGAMNQQTSE